MESPNKPVSELTYYELLGVSKDATPNEIKKGYYKMARFYHPDKNPDDKEAEENFKRVGTAHTVLMDEEKRAIYDKFGEEGVKQSEDGGEFDMAEMLKLLFGAGEFDECFGEISFATAMDPKFYSKSEEEQVAWLEEHQKQREEKLVESLKEKISLYIKDDSKSGRAAFDKFVMDDIHTKEEVPGGPALLSRLGYVYRQEAKQHLSRFLGIESVFAGIAEKGHIVKEAVKIAMSAVEMQQMEENFDPESMTEEEKMEYERQVGEKGMNTMWKLGLLEIESVVRSVCETVMRDTTISKGELKKRKKAILRLGELYRNEGRRLVKEDQNDFDAYQHIEEQLHPNHQDHTEENISEPEKVETSTTNTDTQTPKQEETTTVPDEPLEKKEKNKKESKPPEPEPEPDSCSSSEEVPATGGYDDMD